MVEGMPGRYRVTRETDWHGFTIEPGEYPGIVSGQGADRIADGTIVRHWLKIPDSPDELDVTKLVEDGKIEVL